MKAIESCILTASAHNSNVRAYFYDRTKNEDHVATTVVRVVEKHEGNRTKIATSLNEISSALSKIADAIADARDGAV